MEGNLFQKKKELLARIGGIQRILYSSTDLRVLEENLLNQLNDILAREEILWRQKSRLQWTMDGDRNTKFYHASTLIRRHRNRVDSLKVDGVWISDDVLLKNHTTAFFKTLYCADVTSDYEDFLPPPKSKLDDSMIEALLAPVSGDEVKMVIDQMGGLKAPGPDGVPAIFYQQNWEVTGPTLCRFVRSVFDSGVFPDNLNRSFISLIPKVDFPEVVQQLRPIALSNVSYKLVTKIIVHRLRPFLDRLIASMYLAGEAKLWWRTKYEEMQQGRCQMLGRLEEGALSPIPT